MSIACDLNPSLPSNAVAWIACFASDVHACKSLRSTRNSPQTVDSHSEEASSSVTQ